MTGDIRPHHRCARRPSERESDTMSGPSTRSHRSSVRGVEATLTELSDLLKANKSVLMVTGAGLSAASGTSRLPGIITISARAGNSSIIHKVDL